jgi:hypothetical protein
MGKRIGTDKDTQRYLNAAEQQGWRVSVTGSNHIKCVPPEPDRRIVVGALTGCHTSMKKFRAMLVKEGLRV